VTSETTSSTASAEMRGAVEFFSPPRYAANVEAKDIRSYAGRAWEPVDAEKREHWAKRYREEGPAAIRRAAGGLREHLLAIHPDWPTPLQRDEDMVAREDSGTFHGLSGFRVTRTGKPDEP